MDGSLSPSAARPANSNRGPAKTVRHTVTITSVAVATIISTGVVRVAVTVAPSGASSADPSSTDS